MEPDILDRLKATTKINGAYPKDIADAIAEIEKLRKGEKKEFCQNFGRCNCTDGWNCK